MTNHSTWIWFLGTVILLASIVWTSKVFIWIPILILRKNKTNNAFSKLNVYFIFPTNKSISSKTWVAFTHAPCVSVGIPWAFYKNGFWLAFFWQKHLNLDIPLLWICSTCYHYRRKYFHLLYLIHSHHWKMVEFILYQWQTGLSYLHLILHFLNGWCLGAHVNLNKSIIAIVTSIFPPTLLPH